MKFFLEIITVFLFISGTQTHWQMYWNEEFTQNEIDLKKWIVTNETLRCDGN